MGWLRGINVQQQKFQIDGAYIIEGFKYCQVANPTELLLRINAQGWSLQAYDNTVLTIANYSLPRQVFTTYQATEGLYRIKNLAPYLLPKPVTVVVNPTVNCSVDYAMVFTQQSQVSKIDYILVSDPTEWLLLSTLRPDRTITIPTAQILPAISKLQSVNPVVTFQSTDAVLTITAEDRLKGFTIAKSLRYQTPQQPAKLVLKISKAFKTMTKLLCQWKPLTSFTMRYDQSMEYLVVGVDTPLGNSITYTLALER